MTKALQYSETRPGRVVSDVTCRECEKKVARVTFCVDGSDIGVCTCPWTTWMFEQGKVYRSALLGAGEEEEEEEEEVDISALVEECEDLQEYVRSEDFNTDRLQKYEHAVFEAAVEAVLGKSFWDEVNERTE